MTLLDIRNQYESLTLDSSKAFIKSIRSASTDASINTLSLISCLEKFLEDFRPLGKKLCLSMGQMSDDDREQLILHGKIAVALMIVLQNSKMYSNLTEKTLLFLTYAAAVVKKEYGFAEMFLDTLTYPIVETGLDWYTLQDATSLEILCYKIKGGIRFDKREAKPFSFAGKGVVELKDGVFHICSSDTCAAGSKAFAVVDGRIEVVTRNVREERLKMSEQDDVEVLARFAASFLKAQEGYVTPAPKVKEYQIGDIVTIKFTTVDSFECEILGQGEDTVGKVVDEELVKGIWTRHIIRYLCDDDCIEKAVIIGEEDGHYLYSIKDSYRAYALRCAKEDQRNNIVIEAKVVEVRPDLYEEGRIIWMTPSGYGGISFPLKGHDLKPEDKVPMTVLFTQSSGRTAFINLGEPKYDYARVDKDFSDEDQDVLVSFIVSQETLLADKGREERSAKDAEMIRDLLRLSSVLANRSALVASLESYRQRLAAGFLAKLVGDSETLEAFLPKEFYLRCCLSFAQGNSVTSNSDYALPQEEEDTIRMLSLWDGTVDELMRQMASMTVGTTPWKIGALLLGKQLSSQNKDEISADADTIREKICSLLGVDAVFGRGAGARKGKYGNGETKNVEFKSSYVYCNGGENKGKPDIDYQGRGQVFEAVCGFLNADGGTVYVGVDNDGNPAGLDEDIKWIQMNFDSLNLKRRRQLGHSICKVKDLDNFVQFLNSEKQLYFKESLQGNINIERTEDADAIKITVAPAEYEIAYLYKDIKHDEGEAFIREGERTIPMSRVRKEQRLTELKRIRKEMGFVVDIQEAIDRHGKLVFKGYSSGNSGEVKDRQVVPINLFYNDENVYCYDLVSRKNKQFRLHRISSIEVLPGTYTLQKYQPRKADVFRWLNDGGKQYHIKLRMMAAARNYLLEEYSCAEKLPETEFYEEKKNVWILDTHLNGLGAVRRFYLGLADKIEILDTEDSEELKADIAAYVKENIKYES